MKLPIAAVVTLAVALVVQCADRPPVTWSDLPGVDGKSHSMSDLKGKDVIVVAITRNRCPMAVAYFERMNAFAASGRAAFVAINVQDDDDLDGMRQVAKERGFKFPYLRDETQEVGHRLGATCTPEFFVLNKEREVVYRGAWDDGRPVGKVKERYVEEAVTAALAGKKPAVSETKAPGCSISYRTTR
jgi:peroxiredoxin